LLDPRGVALAERDPRGDEAMIQSTINPAAQRSTQPASVAVRACVLAALALAGQAQVASAVVVLGNGDPISLEALLASTSDRKFQVFDKIFTIESFTSNQFSPSQVTVVGYHHPTNPFEFGFDLTGGFGDASPGDGIIHEFNLQYTVEIAEPWLSEGWRITDNHLIFNGNATGAPGSYARVDETVLNPFNSTVIGQKSVFDIVNPSGPNSTQLADELIWGLPGYTILEINKDVKFLAVDSSSTASASFIRQSFSQIPAPGSATLAAIGVALVARRRRSPAI
jgi:hypothetical protein